MRMKRFVKKKIVQKEIKKERKNELALALKFANDKHMHLTSTEIEKAKNLWGEIATPCTDEYEVFKFFHGFDERFLGHELYLPIIARRLNDYKYTKYYENKNMMDLFKSNAMFPRVILRCVNGEIYDAMMHQYNDKKAQELIEKEYSDMIIKPAVDSANGNHVCKIDKNKKIENLRNEYGSDWLIQECVKQSGDLASFNISSVNTFRVTSLYLNGLFSVCNIIFRFGNPGSVVDNASSGGNFIGVQNDGTLYDNSFDAALNVKSNHNGIIFRNIKFDFIPHMLKSIEQWHTESFSLCKFIGWDIAVDEMGNFIVLEINSSQPGIFVEQIATGKPIFMDRTEEVIEYVKKKDFTYGRSMFRY